MASFLYNEGQNHLLSTYFQNDPPTFGPFYVGLGSGGAFMQEGGSVSDLNELNGLGYSRQMISRDSTPSGWALEDGYVQSPELTFSNSSFVDSWDPVDFAFITLSSEGSSDPNILIAAVEFSSSLDVPAQRNLKVIFRFKQTTTPLDEPRIHSGSVAITSLGLLAAEATVL